MFPGKFQNSELPIIIGSTLIILSFLRNFFPSFNNTLLVFYKKMYKHNSIRYHTRFRVLAKKNDFNLFYYFYFYFL